MMVALLPSGELIHIVHADDFRALYFQRVQYSPDKSTVQYVISLPAVVTQPEISITDITYGTGTKIIDTTKYPAAQLISGGNQLTIDKEIVAAKYGDAYNALFNAGEKEIRVIDKADPDQKEYIGSINVVSPPFITGLKGTDGKPLIDKFFYVGENESLTIEGSNFFDNSKVLIDGTQYGDAGDVIKNGDILTINNVNKVGFKTGELRVVSQDNKIHTVLLNSIYAVKRLSGINVISVTPNTGSVNGATYVKIKNELGKSGLNDSVKVYFPRILSGITESLSEANRAQIMGFDSVTNTLTVKTKKSTSGPGDARIVITDGEGTSRYDDAASPLIFTFVEAGNVLSLNDIDPNVAKASAQAIVQISGKNIITLNVGGLTYTGSSNYDDAEIIVTKEGNSDIKRTVVIIPNLKYNLNGMDYNVNVKKIIQVQIGKHAEIDITGDKFSDLNSFSLQQDVLAVKLPNISEVGSKDIIVTTDTYIYEDRDNDDIIDLGEEELIPSMVEEAILQDFFTYVADFVTPVVTSMTPELGPKDKAISVTIKGSEFLVIQQGKNIISPVLYIGIESNDATMKKLEKVKVYDNTGKLVDGSVGNFKGTIIKAEIPADPDGIEDVQSTLYVHNPDGGLPTKFKKFKFKAPPVEGAPSITEVNPNIVSTKGGDSVVVKGSNFKNTPTEKVDIYVDGEKVSDIKINGTGQEITFKAPKGRSGTTNLQVINMYTGAMASTPFTYTDVYTSPKITKIAPNKGSGKTISTIVGESYLGPDVTAMPGDIYRIVGARVLFNGQDINEYNVNSGVKVLKEFGVQDQPILKQENGSVKLNPYYKAAVLVEENDAGLFMMFENGNGDMVLRDGRGNIYTPIVENGKIKVIDKDGLISSDMDFNSTNAGSTMSFTIGNSPVISYNLTLKTPYRIDAGKNEIVGRRTEFKNSSTLEILIPPMSTGLAKQGDNDVTVVNPDTANATLLKGFFYFTTQGSNPKISGVDPKEGTTLGGTIIKIIGSDFRSSVAVYFGSEKAAKVTRIDDKNLYVELPKYIGILDSISQSADVPVIAVNEEDGGTAIWGDRFVYRVPTSYPRIDQIAPNKGNASGGIDITIAGENFMDGEPYQDLNGNGQYDVGEPFTDLEINGVKNGIRDEDCIDDNQNVIQELSPKVYFGGEKAIILSFSYRRLVVKLPKYLGSGAVDVVIVNPDTGTVVKKGGFTYSVSTPKITSVVPGKGPKTGGTELTINGDGFIIDQDPLKNVQVFIGDEEEDIKSALIAVNPTKIVLNNLEVNHNVLNYTNPKDSKLYNTMFSLSYRVKNKSGEMKNVIVNKYVNVELDKTEYFVEFTPEDFMEVSNNGHLDIMQSELDKLFRGKEIIKVMRKDEILYVTRRLAEIDTVNSTSKMIIVKATPPSLTIGEKSLIVINNDGGQAKSKFEYGNPMSNPIINSITPRRLQGTGTEGKYLVEVSKQGGSEITIQGKDFRDGVRVFIGDQEAQVISKNADDTVLIVRVPAAKAENVEKQLKVTVINTDTASTVSTTNNVYEGWHPHYFVYKDVTTNPKITQIKPNKGPMAGGTYIEITGDDFWDGAKVFIGGVEAEIVSVKYNLIKAKTNAIANPGTYSVEVKNYEGDMVTGTAVLEGAFSYISDPSIVSMYEAAGKNPEGAYNLGVQTSNLRITGGETLLLEVEGILGTPTVIVGGEIKPITDYGNIPAGIQGTTVNSGDVVVTGGVQASVITVQEKKYIVFTSPVGLEGTSTIIIINQDSGVSTPFGVMYIRPVPGSPTGLIAEVVDGNAVKLEWNDTTGGTQYQIFASMGESSTDKDLTNYYYISTTAPVRQANGKLIFYVRNLETSTYYRFRVKNINDFGVSLGYAESNTVKTLDEVKSEFLFNDTYVSESQRKDDVKVLGKTLEYTLGEKTIKDGNAVHFIDWRKYSTPTMDTKTLNISFNVLMNYSRGFVLYDKDSQLKFSSESLLTSQAKNIEKAKYSDSVAKLKITKPLNGRLDEIKLAIPKKYQIIKMITIDYVIQIEKKEQYVPQFAQNIELAITHDYKTYGSDNIIVVYYDAKKSTLKQLPIAQNKEESTLKANIKDLGTYIVLKQK